MIYYIYKVRRKQASIRSSRFTLPHRYLRYISWISWIRRPQAATSWISTRTPPRAATRARIVFAAAPIPQGHDSCGPISASTQRIGKRPPIFPPRKRKNIFLPFFAHLCVSLLPRCSARSSSRVSPIRGRSIARCPRRLLRPSRKQKMRAHGITPRTRSPQKV